MFIYLIIIINIVVTLLLLYLAFWPKKGGYQSTNGFMDFSLLKIMFRWLWLIPACVLWLIYFIVDEVVR